MIWCIVITLVSFLGTTSTYTLEREYTTGEDCRAATVLISEAVDDYVPNPSAGVKRIEVRCESHRPFGN